MKINDFKYIILICVLSVFDVVFSQNTNSNESAQTNAKSISSFDLSSKDIEGSIYLDEEFLPAVISNKEGIFALRFNAYHDEMEFKKQGTAYYLPKTLDYSISFQGDGKKYRVFNYMIKEQQNLGFFLILEQGEKLNLLVKERIRLYDEEVANSGYQKYKPPTLKRLKDKYYIGLTNNSVAVELPTKKKDFLKIFTRNSSAVNAYMKENRIGIKKKPDLIEIFNFYNTL